jgi:hypothetical protein
LLCGLRLSAAALPTAPIATVSAAAMAATAAVTPIGDLRFGTGF